jgi:hypothetical protein
MTDIDRAVLDVKNAASTLQELARTQVRIEREMDEQHARLERAIETLARLANQTTPPIPSSAGSE